MNNTIHGLKDALLMAIGIAESEDSQENKSSALDAVQESYKDYLEDGLMLFVPTQYGLHGFSQEQLNYITSIKLVKPSSEAMQAYLRTFAECENVAMLTALAGLATDMGFSVSGIDRRANSAKLADFSVIIEQLKAGETDDALAMLERISDINSITVE